jgi:predicted PurR-regulated permease PerM
MAAPSRTQSRAFGVLFAVAGFFFLWTVSPIWAPICLGLLLAVVAMPLQDRLRPRFAHHPRLVAAGITLLTLLVGVGLLVALGLLVVREVVGFLSKTGPVWAHRAVAWAQSPKVAHTLARFGQSPNQVGKTIGEHAMVVVTHLTTHLGSLLSVTSAGLVTVLFGTITAYYLLLEGRSLAEWIVRLLPFPPAETRAFIREFRRATVGTLLGVGVIAVVQGVLAGAGFAVARVPQAVVWGALTAVASLVPAIGTGLVCVPVAVVLIVERRIGAGVGVLLWWLVVVVGLCDYVLRPRLLEGRVRLHSLLVLISLFGGLEAFGPLGVVLGPLFVALFVALLRIYERSYKAPVARMGEAAEAPGLQPQNP